MCCILMHTRTMLCRMQQNSHTGMHLSMSEVKSSVMVNHHDVDSLFNPLAGKTFSLIFTLYARVQNLPIKLPLK